MGLGDFQRHHVAELRGERHLAQGDLFRRVGVHREGLAVKDHFALLAVEQLRAQLADLCPQLQRTLFDGLAGDVGSAGRIGAGVVGRDVGVGTEDHDVVQLAVQHFGGDLRQGGVAAGAHICRTDDQRIEAIIVDLEGRAADVHARNAGPLHRHAHADGADLAVAEVADGILVVPVDHVVDFFQAAVQRTAGVHCAVVGGHDIAFPDDVHLTDLERVHVEFCRQLVDGRLHGKQALRCAVAAVSTGGHVVGVHHIADETEGLGLAVQRDGFMARQAHRRGAVLAVSACVREGVQVDAAHEALFGGTEADVHLHLVAGRGSGLALLAGEDELAGLFGLPGDEGRVDGRDRRLFGTKAAADAGLDDADHGFGDVERVGHVAAGMEDDLGRAEDVQTAVEVHIAAGAEGLHHRLLAGLGVIHMVDDHVAVGQHGVDVAAAAFIVGAEIALVVRAHGAQALPVVLRMDEDGVVLGGVEIQHRLQHLILHLDELHRLLDAFVIRTGHDGHDIAHKADVPVDDQTVVGAGLRVGLAGLGVAAGVLVHILPGKDGLDAGHLFGHRGVDGLDDGVGVGRAQQLDDEAVGRSEIVHVDRLTGHELHRVLFPERFVDVFHSAASFDRFHARNA